MDKKECWRQSRREREKVEKKIRQNKTLLSFLRRWETEIQKFIANEGDELSSYIFQVPQNITKQCCKNRNGERVTGIHFLCPSHCSSECTCCPWNALSLNVRYNYISLCMAMCRILMCCIQKAKIFSREHQLYDLRRVREKRGNIFFFFYFFFNYFLFCRTCVSIEYVALQKAFFYVFAYLWQHHMSVLAS